MSHFSITKFSRLGTKLRTILQSRNQSLLQRTSHVKLLKMSSRYLDKQSESRGSNYHPSDNACACVRVRVRVQERVCVCVRGQAYVCFLTNYGPIKFNIQYCEERCCVDNKRLGLEPRDFCHNGPTQLHRASFTFCIKISDDVQTLKISARWLIFFTLTSKQNSKILIFCFEM